MSVLLGDVHRWAALALVGAAALAGCGEEEMPMQTTAPAVTGTTDTASAEKAPGTESPADEPAADPATDRTMIKSTLEAVLGSKDPGSACGDLVTRRYLRRAYGGQAGCADAQRDSRPATSVRVSRIVVLPDSVAQAAVTSRGGVYDGDRLRAELVLETGTWKLDSLRSNVPVGP